MSHTVDSESPICVWEHHAVSKNYSGSSVRKMGVCMPKGSGSETVGHLRAIEGRL